MLLRGLLARSCIRETVHFHTRLAHSVHSQLSHTCAAGLQILTDCISVGSLGRRQLDSRTSERADRRAPTSLISTIKKKQSSFTREFAFTYRINNNTKITTAIWSFNSTTSGKVAVVCFTLCVCELKVFLLSPLIHLFKPTFLSAILLTNLSFALSAQSCPSVCVCMIVWVIFFKHVWVWPVHVPRELLLQKVRNWNHPKLVNSAVNVTAENLCCHGYVLLILLK